MSACEPKVGQLSSDPWADSVVFIYLFIYFYSGFINSTASKPRLLCRQSSGMSANSNMCTLEGRLITRSLKQSP